MTHDVYNQDWDGPGLEGLGDDGDSAVSDNSLFGILHGVLGGSGSIGSFDGYGDDFSDDTANSEGNVKVEVEGEGREGGGRGVFPSSGGTNGLAGEATEKRLKEESRVKQLDNPATTERLSAACTADHSGTGDAHDRRSSCDDIRINNANEGMKLATTEQDGSERTGKGRGDDGDDGKHGNAYGDNDYLIRFHYDDNDTQIPSARWPTRKSVQSSSGYIYYATEAGDYGFVQHVGTPGAVGRRNEQQERWPRRHRRVRRPKTGGAKKQADDDERSDVGDDGGSAGSHIGSTQTTPSPTLVRGQHIVCMNDSGGGSAEPADKGKKNLRDGKRKDKKPYGGRRNNVSGGRRHCDEGVWAHPTTGHLRGRSGTEREVSGNGRCGPDGIRARHSLGCRSTGLSTLETDVREAMVAVWLAWGVRIDAAREQLRREEKRLRVVFRANTAKLKRSSHAGDWRGQDGITSEVLEFVAKEGVLRELGESDLADSSRQEALLARRRSLARGRDALNLRRPVLETVLRNRQAAKVLAVRRFAEKRESKLARDRDETMRLLKLYFSRAWRLVCAGATNTASRARQNLTRLRREGSPMLHERDLLKLGKVLLLAQETTNNSIERALGRGRTEQAEGETTPPHGCTDSSAAHGALLLVGKQGGRACGNACARSRCARTCGGKHAETTDMTIDNYNESISKERTKACVGRRLVRVPETFASSCVLPRQPHRESLNPTGAATDAAALKSQGAPCLWCNPASAAVRQRWHRVAAVAKMKDRHRHDIIRQGVACRRQGGATAARARQPRCFGDASSQPPPPAMHRRAARRQWWESEPLQHPPLTTADRTSDGAAVEIDEQRQVRPLAGSSQDLISFGDDGLSEQHRQEQANHLGWCSVSPGAFYCSWECAGRWNARFSPVQARHERGLRIDLAAGRLVAR